MERDPNGVVFVIKDGNRYLTEIRVKTKGNYYGQVIFPGGRMESEETPDQVMRREVCEECGVDVESYENLGIVSVDHPNGPRPMWLFYITKWRGEIQNREYRKGVHLFFPSNSIRILCRPSDVSILDKILRHVEKS